MSANPGHHSTRLTGIAQSMATAGLLSHSELCHALQQAKSQNSDLLSCIIGAGLLSASKIAIAISTDFGLPLLNLDSYRPDQIAAASSQLDLQLMRQHQVLPLKQQGNMLLLAVSDPTNAGLDAIRFQTGLNIEIVVAEYDKLQTALNNLTGQTGTQYLEPKLDSPELVVNDAPIAADDLADVIDEAPIVRFINRTLQLAIRTQASDIHFEPYETLYRVRFRIDGMLHEISSPPVTLGQRLASRLKVMAKLNIAERRLPQDGRIRIKADHAKSIDFRINTLPTLWGEKVVLRLLNSNADHIELNQLGCEKEQLQAYLEALTKPQGMILVTGPTGSGKTVTLYAGLKLLNQTEVNIATVEDPIEINMVGVNQVGVNSASGLSFSVALRAFLRQDPDVLMVGEIRDAETAEIAVKAAQTGHRVLSTLHTSRAVATLTRLANLGISQFNIADSVSLIIAQRLARRLCKYCKKPQQLSPPMLCTEGFQPDEVSTLQLFEATGCKHCTNGYKGRIGIYEMLAISPAITELIMANANSIELTRQAQAEGYTELRQVALNRVKDGLTSLSEINRVAC